MSQWWHIEANSECSDSQSVFDPGHIPKILFSATEKSLTQTEYVKIAVVMETWVNSLHEPLG